MKYLATILVPDDGSLSSERELATGSFPRVADAKGWLARNRLTWLGALEPNEHAIEMWVQNARGTAVLCIRHTRKNDEHGEVRHEAKLKKGKGDERDDNRSNKREDHMERRHEGERRGPEAA